MNILGNLTDKLEIIQSDTVVCLRLLTIHQ